LQHPVIYPSIFLIFCVFAYALFSSGEEYNEETEFKLDENESNVVVNDFSGRYVTMSCQTCRKLKKHKEVKPNLFQCVKCKRHVDIRDHKKDG
jgi:acetyl-CoA carboxylase beta subunit